VIVSVRPREVEPLPFVWFVKVTCPACWPATRFAATFWRMLTTTWDEAPGLRLPEVRSSSAQPTEVPACQFRDWPPLLVRV
jgi:hypothetical protein